MIKDGGTRLLNNHIKSNPGQESNQSILLTSYSATEFEKQKCLFLQCGKT